MTDREGGYVDVMYRLATDPDYLGLSAEARLVLLTLMLLLHECGPATGFGRLNMEDLVESSGLDHAACVAALDELCSKPSQKKPWLVKEGRLLWIRNMFRFQGSYRHPRTLAAVLRRVESEYGKTSIAKAFVAHYRKEETA